MCEIEKNTTSGECVIPVKKQKSKYHDDISASRYPTIN